MASIMSFFSPEHVIHLLDIFWDRWYPHCPILHRATFNVEYCSPLLLASMVLMGGCTSSSEADQRIARSLLDIAENIVFSHPIYSTTTSIPKTTHQDNDPSIMGNIRILQATYLICIMQKWEGSEESKIRIQRDQFTKFVSVCTQSDYSRFQYSILTFHRPQEQWDSLKARMEIQSLTQISMKPDGESGFEKKR